MTDQVPPIPTKKHGIYYGYIIVVCLFFIMMVMLGANFAFGVFFKPVSDEFNWSRSAISGAFAVCTLVSGALGIIMGHLNDRLGPRPVLTFCGILVGVGFLLMSQIHSLWQLFLFYGVIIGIGLAGAYVPPLSTIARWFTLRRSFMSGIVLIGLSLGTTLAGPVANKLITFYDWRYSYLIVGGAVLIVVLIASQFLKRDPTTLKLKSPGEDKESKQNIIMEGVSLKHSLNTRQFWTVIVMEFAFGFILITILVHLVPHITDQGISPATAAAVLAVAGGFSILGRLILGPAGDKVGNRNIYVTGFILMATDVFWLITLKEIGALYIFAAIFGFAYGGMESSESPIVAWLFGIRAHGLIFGVVTMSFTLGGAAGPFIAGYIFDVSGSYQIAFLILGSIGIVGLISTITLKPLKNVKNSLIS